MWPDPRVVDFVTRNFIPSRVHVREDAADFQRFGARYGALWTPTILILDEDANERHRIEGFVSADEMLAQLTVGLGQIAFKNNRFAEAEPRFREAAEKYPGTDTAAEAQYWTGVARYKQSHDVSALRDAYRVLTSRYPESTWAKKAEVWKPRD